MLKKIGTVSAALKFLEDGLTSTSTTTTTTTQQQLGAHITSCCLGRCFTAVGELAHTQRSREKIERERKVRDSVMHWVRGMPNYNHL